MYQDLLRCCARIEKNTFIKLFDIIDWMLTHNKELTDYYSQFERKNTPFPARRSNRRNTIKEYLDDLVSLGLMTSRAVKEERGDGNTTEYTLQDWGYLTSWIMDIDEKNNNSEVLGKIFTLLQQNFATLTTSRDAFFSIFLKKCKENNYFESYVLYLKNLLNNPSVKDKSTFLRYFLFVSLDNNEETKKLWQIWRESFFELAKNKTMIEYFTQYLKIQLEYIIDQKINAYAAFEKLRFENSYTYVDELVIELKCSNCEFYYPTLMNIITFLDMVINQDYQILEGKHCNVCKKGKLELTPQLRNFTN